MKKNNLIRLAVAVLMTAVMWPGEVYAKTPTMDEGYDCPSEVELNGNEYKLFFSDDFDYFDYERWARLPDIKRQDLGGEWRHACSYIEDGKLVVKCDIDNGTPISGGIRCVDDNVPAFGLYNIRFKMDKADGLWYAFWMYTDNMENSRYANGNANDGAEVDIIEVVPGAKEYGMSVHWNGYGKDLRSYSKFNRDLSDDFFDSYHDLWFLWDENGYRLYMDGMDEDSLMFAFEGPEYKKGFCFVPLDLIISAEYGTWGGDIKKEQLPAYFYVDYVRLYTK